MLDFQEILESEQFSSFTIVMEVYTDEENKDIYNVSIECEREYDSVTLDLFESYDYNKALDKYNKLIKNIKKTMCIEEK